MQKILKANILSFLFLSLLIISTNSTFLNFQSVEAVTQPTFTIKTEEDFRAFANDSSLWTADNYILLENDFTLDHSTAYTAIGTNTNRFEGIFDGNNKTITIANSHSFNLFEYIGENGQVKNTNVMSNFQSYSYTLGITEFNYGLIENCTTHSDKVVVPADIGSCFDGGIAAYNYGIIRQSKSDMKFLDYVGELHFSAIGGIVCKNFGLVSQCYYFGNIEIHGHQPPTDAGIGGIVSFNHGTIENCFNNADINADQCYAGNIVGTADDSQYSKYPNIIKNCYNLGTNNCSYNAGIVGFITEDMTIKDCYNIGFVSTSFDKGGIYCGMNINVTATISNCFYLSNSNITNSSTQNIKGIKNLDTAMKDPANYTTTYGWSANWDFDSIWTFIDGENNGYPVLQCFYLPTTCQLTLDINFNSKPNNGIIIYIMKEDANIFQIYVDQNTQCNFELENNTTITIVISKPYFWNIVYTGSGTPTSNGYTATISSDTTIGIEIGGCDNLNNYIFV